MATFTVGTPQDAFGLINGPQSAENINFFRQQTQEFASMVMGYAPEFATNVLDTLESIHGDEAIRRAKALQRQVAHVWQSDVIRPIESIEDCCTAPPVMRRWLMADPYMRQMYHSGQIDGYSQSYYDAWGKVRGEDHYDYRRVTEGMIEIDEDGCETFTSWFEEIEEDDVLSIEEQVDITTGWKFLRSSVKAGIDPTSRFGTKL